MHPGQRMRERREEANRTGRLEIRRFGRLIAVVTRGEPQGTGGHRPWNVWMQGDDEPILGGFGIAGAEGIAIKEAKRRELAAA